MCSRTFKKKGKKEELSGVFLRREGEGVHGDVRAGCLQCENDTRLRLRLDGSGRRLASSSSSLIVVARLEKVEGCGDVCRRVLVCRGNVQTECKAWVTMRERKVPAGVIKWSRRQVWGGGRRCLGLLVGEETEEDEATLSSMLESVFCFRQPLSLS